MKKKLKDKMPNNKNFENSNLSPSEVNESITTFERNKKITFYNDANAKKNDEIKYIKSLDMVTRLKQAVILIKQVYLSKPSIAETQNRIHFKN